MIKKLAFIILGSGLILSACSNSNDDSAKTEESKTDTHEKKTNHEEHSDDHEHGEHDEHHDEHSEHMHHDESDPPENMKSTNEGEFKKGEDITITSGHMDGMKNAPGTIKGAYKTYAYTVSYTPTDGGKEVKDHKWIVNEEIANAPKDGFKKGDTVKLEADHMPGMKGAEAKIDSVQEKILYVVDFKSTEDNEEVKNHKWLTGDELKSR